MARKKLVIVESPTKARTIRRFLGKDFIVESCMGHVRDLPQSAKDIPEIYKKEPWSKLGVNVDKNFAPIYCIPRNKTKVVKALKDKLKEADELYLATDEDREGESISWHLVEVLKPKVPMKRMVFHEITKKAIDAAVKNSRDIDYNLVRAQEARRILDRLVGYTLSPLIWKKIAFGLSAGRVQSVAVRLIAEREHERMRFVRSEYWGVQAQLEKEKSAFEARLHSYEGQRVATGKDFSGETGQVISGRDVRVVNEPLAQELAGRLKSLPWKITEVEEKPTTRRPAPPFITSTLQQESNRKLGLGSRETMQVAQKLYEQGYITYMRTDSTFLSEEAVGAARRWIKEKYGNEYVPDAVRTYAAKKVKGAQEAHEAIRPAGSEFTAPDDTGLSGLQYKLYDLIWKRAVASQMVDARQKQVSIRIEAGNAQFAASGMTIEFPGFLRAYVEGSDDPEAGLQDREVHLPKLKVGDQVGCSELKPTQHETKPPARYTEASLVQTMEKEGIGRPSTYASIISTIIDRGYVRKAGSALVPTFTALVVSKLLRSHLPQYVDPGFTSEMEQSLDKIADGDLDWEGYLHSVYFGDEGLRESVDREEEKIDPDEARSIKLDGLDSHSFRVGRYGAYVCRTEENEEEVCASIPETEPPADITAGIADKLIDQKIKGADALGEDPETGLPIYVLTGRYGPYVQLGDSDGEKEKPKRASIPAGVEPEDVDLNQAIQLLSLPKTLGEHTQLKKDVKVGLGRFGPYVVCDGDYRSIPKGESLFEVSFERAMELLSQPKKGGRRSRTALVELGEHPVTKDPMQIFNGPYGLYVKCGKVNASLPEDAKAEDLTKEQAIKLLEEKDPQKMSKAPGQTKAAAKSKVGAKKKTKKKAKQKAKQNAKEKTEKSAAAGGNEGLKKKTVLKKAKKKA